MYSQSGAEEPIFWTFKQLIIFFSDTTQSLFFISYIVQGSLLGADVVAKTNIITSFVEFIQIISKYEALHDVKYSHKVGAIELVRNSSPTHTDLFNRLTKRGKELLLSYF